MRPVSMRPMLVLGLGNPILKDDAIGLVVARRVREVLAPEEPVEVVEAELAGFALVDLLADRPAAVIIDALVSPEDEPGTVIECDLADFQPTGRLATMHQVDLPTAMGLGEQLGRAMPREVRVLAVVAGDAQTFGEELTPALAAVVDSLVERTLVLARDLVLGSLGCVS